MRRIQRARESDLSVTTIPSYNRLFTNQATTNSGEVVKYGTRTAYALLLLFPIFKNAGKNYV